MLNICACAVVMKIVDFIARLVHNVVFRILAMFRLVCAQ